LFVCLIVCLFVCLFVCLHVSFYITAQYWNVSRVSCTFVFRNVVLSFIHGQLDLAKGIAIKDVFEKSVRSILYNGRIINYGCMRKAERKYRTKLTYFSEAQCTSMDCIAELLFKNWWLKWFVHVLGSKNIISTRRLYIVTLDRAVQCKKILHYNC